MNENLEALIQSAVEVRNKAYAPYSKFLVGAALQTKSGKIYTGCNVENASYGLAICAERNAICQAIADGESEFETIVIVADPLATPCGACRQFIFEFGKQINVVCVDANELTSPKSFTISDLLPAGFEF